MRFSDYFNISPEMIAGYGTVDISLICDTPLFIDPMLIFNSEKGEYRKLHEEIIRYFHFLSTKAQHSLTNEEIRTWFSFSEVKNNWFGFSFVGNNGLALGWDYAVFLYKNIAFAITTNNISSSAHIEKIMLLYSRSGKDKISDLTVNLIKHYLLEYTQTFAAKHIDPSLCMIFPVEKSYFNYATESFVSKEYTLPYINTSRGAEFVLLTPSDILRVGEPAINRQDFFNSQIRIRESIDDDVLRATVNNYILKAIREYENNQRKKQRPTSEKTLNKIERNAFTDLVEVYPELYDYYVRLKEHDSEEIRIKCKDEVSSQIEKLLVNSRHLVSDYYTYGYLRDESISAKEEAKRRIVYFKHVIEECDGYRSLYYQGKRISGEDDIRRLFRLVWFETSYKVDFDTNNGRGEADVIISKGQENQNIVEFKLACNKKLAHVFEQVKIYENANCAEGSLIVIFYFSQNEYETAKSMITNANYDHLLNESIFLVDCRNDNKPSASKV